MGATTISWTDTVWNPTRGCSRVNPDCDRCYAIGQARRSHGPGGAYEGLTTIRKGRLDWTGKARFVPEKLSEPLHWRKGKRIFVNSMSDLFHPSITNEQIAAVFGVMAACPQHTFQILTKQPKRAGAWFGWIGSRQQVLLTQPSTPRLECTYHAREVLGDGYPLTYKPGAPWPLPNVHLGISAGHQDAYDDFVPLLLQCPAAVHFVSLEPLTELVELSPSHLDGYPVSQYERRSLDWVIVGGESGAGARPCDLGWIRRLVRQCRKREFALWSQRVDVAVFVKQLGARPVGTWNREGDDGPRNRLGVPDGDRPAFIGDRFVLKDRHGGDPSEWPADLRVREFPRA